ncbi:hypothetical protein BV898_15732 [Hypsibius exemplaris]|uniref:Retrotransposon gag domain-containing protein n=1 Tax=Hypsibius exemplaris TaxID=2072580 RepID=A0A9X6NDL4_HYPEX|nr:hypothetical protein BV898_15732 [Hypsibius exemplaris]
MDIRSRSGIRFKSNKVIRSQSEARLGSFTASWYAKETHDGAATFTTWTLFRATIIKRFEAEDFKAQIKRELNYRKRAKGEPVEDYFNDVLTLCDKYDRVMDDDDIIEKLQKLQNGLYPELMSRVCISHASTPMSFLFDMNS